METTKIIDNRGDGNLSPSPLIFWDGYGLSGPYSGILTHAQSLAEALKMIGINPIIVGMSGIRGTFPDHQHAIIDEVSFAQRIAHSKLAWTFKTRAKIDQFTENTDKIHIAHGLSNFNIPLGAPRANQRRVLTVHDVIPLIDPKAVSATYYWQFRILMARAVEVADKIICVSNWTMQGLLSFYPHVEERCTIIPNGIGKRDDLVFKRKPPQDHGLEILSIARYEVYKRLDFIVQIAQRSPKTATVHLVTNEPGREYCAKMAPKLIESQKLILYVGIPRTKLDQLYIKSDILIHPSLYEGFNLPAAEAMRRGLPVIYCRGLATDELLGIDLGIGLEASDSVDIWLQAIDQAYKYLQQDDWEFRVNSKLCLSTSWDESALSTKNLYNSLA